MPARSDVFINWELSPRILFVQSPSTEISVQDLHDTLVGLQDSPEGGQHPDLISTTGKENLGGGTLVGMTAELQNTKVAFEKYVVVNEFGTVTTGDASGVALIDSAATFVTNGIEPGDVVLNDTDNSIAIVLTVDSETQITTDGLIGGTDNQFDSADSYTVYDWLQCDLSGGNVVAVDVNGDPIDPVFRTFGTQVVTTSSSSATLQQLDDIQDQSFTDARIFINTGTGVAGTAYPIGTTTAPVNNFADAVAINAQRSFANRYLLKGSLSLTAEDLTSHNFLGTSLPGDSIDLGGSTTSGTTFERLKISGACSGVFTARECVLMNVAGFNGFLFGGAIAGTLTLATGEAHIVNAHAAATGADSITIDCNGAATDTFIAGWDGALTISNHTNAASKTKVDLNAGKVILDASNTAGTVVVAGVGSLVDIAGAPISTGNFNGVTVVNETVDGLDVKEIAERMGLRIGVPVTIQSTQITFGTVVIGISGNETSGYVLTRTS